MSKPQFTLTPRLLIDRAAAVDSASDVFKTWTLPEILDTLLQMQRLGKPEDYTVHHSRLQVCFVGGRMTVQLPSGVGPGKAMPLFSMAASQLQADVLPGHFWSGFKQLAKLDPLLAEQVWQRFAAEQKRARRIRTIRIRQNGEVFRVMRAMVSTNYARYSHTAFVQDILSVSDHFSTLPVLSWSISDTGMRIKFLGIDEMTEALSALDSAILTDEPLPCVEVWNSETRQGNVACAAGAYNIRTKSGMAHWDGRAMQGWAHRGDPSRMADRVQTAFPLMTKHAADLVHAYGKAQRIGLEDPKAWLTEQLGDLKDVSQRVLDAAIAALESDQVTPGKKLATVIDALTIAAAQESNLFTRSNVERATARLLHTGNVLYEQSLAAK